jgi:hypothetical protein
MKVAISCKTSKGSCSNLEGGLCKIFLLFLIHCRVRDGQVKARGMVRAVQRQKIVQIGHIP